MFYGSYQTEADRDSGDEAEIRDDEGAFAIEFDRQGKSRLIRNGGRFADKSSRIRTGR